MAISVEHRSKFAALYRQWWRLQMSQKLSSWMKNSQLTNKHIYEKLLVTLLLEITFFCQCNKCCVEMCVFKLSFTHAGQKNMGKNKQWYIKIFWCKWVRTHAVVMLWLVDGTHCNRLTYLKIYILIHQNFSVKINIRKVNEIWGKCIEISFENIAMLSQYDLRYLNTLKYTTDTRFTTLFLNYGRLHVNGDCSR